MLDYEMLRIIWWALLGVLLAGFAVMGGIDLGVGTLLPFVAKNNTEKRILINSVGPSWEGNQVWFVLGGGAIFAAWPFVYAVAFSTLYIALLLVLLALILRPVGFDFRHKINSDKWRAFWDIALFIGGFVPTLVFGVAVGNALQGISFSFDQMLVIQNQVAFLSLFTPFTLLCGLLSIAIITTQGAAFLILKTNNPIQDRCRTLLLILPFFTIAIFAVFLYMLSKMDGYIILDLARKSAPSNPLNKIVMTETGAWLNNFSNHSWMIVAPICGFAFSLLVTIAALLRYNALTILASSLSILSIMSTIGFAMFPFLVPSNLNYNASLTVWDASSSEHTLQIMLIAAIIFVPLILCYTSWAYKVMFGKVTKEQIKQQDRSLY